MSTGDRSAKIRTYNFPQGRVTDHRIGYTTHDLQGFLGGDIQPMIDALTVAENAERMKELKKNGHGLASRSNGLTFWQYSLPQQSPESSGNMVFGFIGWYG